MKQISFVNGKGGVGKTTVSLLIASTLKQAEYSVCIDDRDTEQQTASLLAAHYGLEAGTECPLVITDTAPSLSQKPTLEAITQSDAVIIVTGTSPNELATTRKTADLITQIRKKDKPTRILFNRIEPHTRLGKSIDAIKDELPFPALKNYLKERQAYKLSALHGWKEFRPECRDELFKTALEIAKLLY